MIIDFTVKNFRSIKEEQTFCLYTRNKGQQLPENVLHADIFNGFGVLRSIGLYGANASGKSNLLLAIKALRSMVVLSAELKEGDPIPTYEPFRLCQNTREASVALEIEFAVLGKGVRYRYRIEFLRKKIQKEVLEVYKTAKPAVLFARGESGDSKDIEFGALCVGGKKAFSVFPNQCYLSKAGGDADAPEILRDAYNYLRSGMISFGIKDEVVLVRLAKDAALLKTIGAILNSVDTGIWGVRPYERKFKLRSTITEEEKNDILSRLQFGFQFAHKGDGKEIVTFPMDDESDGTQRVFQLLAPIIDALRNGYVLIIDELENSLHPYITEMIIRLFNNPKTNTGNGQLIFSTHQPNLMKAALMRRDQSWLCEKVNGESRFFSIADFDKKRKVDPAENPYGEWYLDGRYHAVPSVDYEAIERLLSGGSDAKE